MLDINFAGDGPREAGAPSKTEDVASSEALSLSALAAVARAEPVGRVWALPVALFILFSGFADAISTSMAIGTGGAVEANPLVRAVQDLAGPAWVGPKLALHAALAALTVWYPNRPTLVLMALVSLIATAVSAHNVALFIDLAR
ncbi:MAG: DUF5658 family protein [Pseudomonadota bacterium]